MCPAMALWMMCSTSARVRHTAAHPGRSGTVALWVDAPFEMTTAYCRAVSPASSVVVRDNSFMDLLSLSAARSLRRRAGCGLSKSSATIVAFESVTAVSS